jgi:Spy/CpxP family protein refolding chaperone
MMSFDESGELGGRAGGATMDIRLPPGRPSRARSWISVALVMVVFVAGFLCGAAAMRKFPGPRQPVDWSDLLSRVAKRMQQDLDLTEVQQTDIQAIVRAHQPELDQIRTRTIREMRTELQQVMDEMCEVLTTEQASRFRSEAQPRLDKFFPADGDALDAARTSNN